MLLLYQLLVIRLDIRYLTICITDIRPWISSISECRISGPFLLYCLKEVSTLGMCTLNNIEIVPKQCQDKNSRNVHYPFFFCFKAGRAFYFDYVVWRKATHLTVRVHKIFIFGSMALPNDRSKKVIPIWSPELGRRAHKVFTIVHFFALCCYALTLILGLHKIYLDSYYVCRGKHTFIEKWIFGEPFL